MAPPIIWQNSIPPKFRVLLKLVLEKQHEPLNSNHQTFMQCSTCRGFLPGSNFPNPSKSNQPLNKDSLICFRHLATEFQEGRPRLYDQHAASCRALPFLQRHISRRRSMAEFAAELEQVLPDDEQQVRIRELPSIPLPYPPLRS